MLLPENLSKLNLQTLKDLDTQDPVKVAAFKKNALELGISEEFSLGIIDELQNIKKAYAPSPAEQMQRQLRGQSFEGRQAADMNRQLQNQNLPQAERQRLEGVRKSYEDTLQQRMSGNRDFQQSQMQMLRDQIARANPQQAQPQQRGIDGQSANSTGYRGPFEVAQQRAPQTQDRPFQPRSVYDSGNYSRAGGSDLGRQALPAEAQAFAAARNRGYGSTQNVASNRPSAAPSQAPAPAPAPAPTASAPQAPAAPQQAQNSGAYNQAIQQLLKANPALGQAGSEDNTKFINDLKSQFGENYKSVLQNDPSKLTAIAGKYQKPANTSVASAPAPAPTASAPAPAPAAPAPAPTPVASSPGTTDKGLLSTKIDTGNSFAPQSLKLGQLTDNYKLAGFIDTLEEEGANEDFILGFLKEANLTYTDLPEDRHRILPFMNNQATGAVGGMTLGNLVSNELDLDGVPGMLLPILGAYAGYSHLPSLMNKWKDPAGQGENAIHPAVSSFVNARNFGPEPGSANFMGPPMKPAPAPGDSDFIGPPVQPAASQNLPKAPPTKVK